MRSRRDAVALEAEAWRGAQPVGGALEPVAVALEHAADADARCDPRARSRLPQQLIEVGDDELAGGGGCRGADVGGEVAERRVLLVTDRRDDGDAARRDGAHDALVAEREQILEAASATGEDDHVDVRLLAERGERGDDLRGGARPLDVRLCDEDATPAGSASGSS